MILKAGYGLDLNGFIVSDVSKDKIDHVYLPCIRESIDCLRKAFPEKLHSVYVYGSVARGEAIAVRSDLDLIAMFKCQLSTKETAALKSLGEELSHKYRSNVREVGMAVANVEYTLDPFNYYENAFIKELCVCVYGEDLGKQFGPYKLTPEIPIAFNGDICESLTRTLNKFILASDEEVQIISQGFARKLIRTFYSMVMVRGQIWSTRLREQAEVVIHHFPDKKSIILILLKWIEEPPTDRDSTYELMKREGEWACANFAQEVIVCN
ncbi:nucleotidyltransferase domain-containing protein [Alteribacter aurantiacus]|uniref:nucleotidyltransferase domain-containing protein n=1 Tax=Alteribacter aurantiacus TaxID=254410 RepID=UPI00041206E0|nr:nucleotidyltransferase domain-containing protein [Alteribacter aurantiacus]